MVNKCNTCAKLGPVQKEPLFPSSLPDRPWSRSLAMDLFDIKGQTYIVVVDYYSHWVVLSLLEKLNSVFDIKSIFATYGIPEAVVSDNGPQFSSASFQAFAKEFGFIHITSSPRYPQSKVTTEKGSTVYRNRSHLLATPEPTTTQEPGDNTPSSTRQPDTPSPARESAQTAEAPAETPCVSRYGREMRVPTRLDL
ncbi:uncharacterized protein K02A2.6-like [Aplysia californica]|uniref:Uncharacterized protein K02A2.6-like n=1 Tax=Aplysia californica TaxID=6500 RepID=A0ABM0ZZ78_APLCA|nr:uncharacterized protein K02A2.6-like [Aplysia californica]